MRPLRRRDRQETTAAGTDWGVRAFEYRRLGHALASVAVALEPAKDGSRPEATARLTIESGGASATLAPTMISHESPGSRSEVHRLWFTADLSMVMFGDGEYKLLIDGATVPLPEPAPQPSWSAGEEDESGVPETARSEAELTAAVAALEERCHDAERTAQEMAADSRRMGQTMAATLAEVQRERDALLDRVARATAGGEHSAPRREMDMDRPVAPPFAHELVLARIDAARGAVAHG